MAQKRITQLELYEWIVARMRERPGCETFSRDHFRLLGAGEGWQVHRTNELDDWDSEWAHQFPLVVASARERFTVK